MAPGLRMPVARKTPGVPYNWLRMPNLYLQSIDLFRNKRVYN